MKKIFLFALLMLSNTILLGQSYVEVKGEADLSIYLNNKFQGKITDETNIFIIENVTPGKNLIKIVKEGYTSFEETIIVKDNEVLAYKVKPFTKHKVYVSEEGNTEETDKKATVKTGKLVIQSVPIEIKITIPDIDGINKSAKTKDKWQADEIPAGNYKITFTYNQKVITKTIEVFGSETTSLFVNMLSGAFKTSNSLDERKAKEREDYLKYYTVNNLIDSLCTKYKFKKGLTESQFRNYNPEAAEFMSSCYQRGKYSEKEYLYGSKLDYTKLGKPGPVEIIFCNDIIQRYNYNIIIGNDKANEAMDSYNKIVNIIESSIPKEFITKSDDGSNIEIKLKGFKVSILGYTSGKKGNGGSLSIHFDNWTNNH